MKWTHDAYELTDDPTRVEVDVVTALLHATYWAAERPRQNIEESIQHSLCFSLYTQGQQVGLARVLTDQGASSYLCDVVIHPDHRGQAIGKWLMGCILEHPHVQKTRMLLVTKDAQDFYRQFGFATHPYECMVEAK